MSRTIVIALLVLTACKERQQTAAQPEPAPNARARAPADPTAENSVEPEGTADPERTGQPGPQPAAYCTHIERCGCPMDACLDTMGGMISSAPVHDLASCVTRLPCEEACSDAADRSSTKYTRCVAPIQAALEERGRSIESMRAMTRNVIGNYPGSTRVKNYDETGKYLGESQR